MTPAENLHLTLAFLGEIDDGAAAQARDAVALSAGESARGTWSIKWSRSGVFPGRSRPRVLWLGVTDDDERLAKLHATLTEHLRSRALPVEERRFRPHLTLARVRPGRLSRERTAEILGFLELVPVPATTEVRSLVLYQSVLGRGPALHQPVFEAPFA